MILGVDVGGTFTDAVLLGPSGSWTAKTPTTAPQSEGVLHAAARVLAAAGVEAAEVERFVHGMTVATNALLEEAGARVAVVTTEGFRDLLAIGRQNRDQLYTLHPRRRPPLVPPERTVTAAERVGPEGVVRPLSHEEAERVAAAVAALEPEAVAVCLLWSFADPAHEARIAEALRGRLGDAVIVVSSQVAPVFREFERLSTTVVDAYVTPRTRRYLDRLAADAADAGLPVPEIMLSSGGTAAHARARMHGAELLLSGPAGGVVAAEGIGGDLGLDRVLTFDMGGTSTDCAAVTVGASADARSLRTSTERRVAGHVVRLPMVDIHTVSAGGGSIAWVDGGGALKVGPQSAGADPGPACYGRGGDRATVTDADLVLGRIYPGAPLGGSLRLEEGPAREVMLRLADAAGLGLEEAAEGVLRIAVFNMAAALRKVTTERGLDPRRYTLVAFGGAGGLHACELAEQVGISEVLVPLRAGVLSAAGLAVAPARAEAVETVLRLASSFGAADWRDLWARLEEGARRRLGEETVAGPGTVEVAREVEARYRGQAFELAFRIEAGEGPGEMARVFHHLHEERYGYAEEDSPVELVTARAVAEAVPPAVSGEPSRPVVDRVGTTEVWSRGARGACPVYALTAAAVGTTGDPFSIEGPALFSAEEFSVFLPAGWRALPTASALRLTRTDAQGAGS